MSQISRRGFLKVGMAGAGTLLVPQGLFAQLRPRLNDDHFFLQIVLDGGADFSYLFDARPLAMTAAGKIQNYIGEDPLLLAGSNGGSCLRTKLTAPLMPFQNRFSVVNGVLMATNFEGHGQNMNYLFTGNPFGGESFVPHLNWESLTATPLDGVVNGNTFLSVNNHSSMVPMEPDAVGGLTGQLHQLPVMRPQDELAAHIRRRLAANGAGSGRFSAGSRQMLEAFDGMEGLHGKLLNLEAGDSGADAETRFVHLISQLFKLKVGRSALWILSGANLDTHDATSAKAQPATFQSIADKIALIFRLMSETPYDGTRSMMDVTTVMISSEFGRTMRIGSVPVDQTGTNHNPLCNSMILAGKGIRGGQVIGASDFASATETLSGAHLALEPRMESVMGRPFDFATGRPRTDLPAAFNVEDYLTVASVVNTVYEFFSAPKAHYRVLSRGGSPAPLVPGLLL